MTVIVRVMLSGAGVVSRCWSMPSWDLKQHSMQCVVCKEKGCQNHTAVCKLTLRMAAGLKATLKVFLQCFHSASLGVEIMLKCLGASCRRLVPTQPWVQVGCMSTSLGTACCACQLGIVQGEWSLVGCSSVAAGAWQAGSCINTVYATLLDKDACMTTAGSDRRLACSSLHASSSCRSGMHASATTHALHSPKRQPICQTRILLGCWMWLPDTHHFDDLVHPGELRQGWRLLAGQQCDPVHWVRQDHHGSRAQPPAHDVTKLLHPLHIELHAGQKRSGQHLWQALRSYR